MRASRFHAVRVIVPVGLKPRRELSNWSHLVLEAMVQALLELKSFKFGGSRTLPSIHRVPVLEQQVTGFGPRRSSI
jgi:hypothetical protein